MIALLLQVLLLAVRDDDYSGGSVTVPSPSQLAWQARELGAMVTYNMQTMKLIPVNSNVSCLPASAFAPTNLNTDQWIASIAAFGGKYAVLTATHRSGFALWPTTSHNYSVRSSPTLQKRDILAEFVASCKKHNVSAGVFWTQRFNDFFGVPNGGLVEGGGGGGSSSNRSTHCNGTTCQHVSQAFYDSMMEVQLKELSTYGFDEFWVNGNIEGPGASSLEALVLRLWPNAVCHGCFWKRTRTSKITNALRWVGNEHALAPMPLWSATEINSTNVHGNAMGSLWAPASCDAVLREHCWFGGNAYPPGHCKMSSTTQLLSKFMTSVGRGCNLILNVAPGIDGSVDAAAVAAYEEMGKGLRSLFGARLTTSVSPLMPTANVSGGGRVMEPTLKLSDSGRKPSELMLVLREDQRAGQLINTCRVECQASTTSTPGRRHTSSNSIAPWVLCGKLQSIGSQHFAVLNGSLPSVAAVRIVLESDFAVGAQVPALSFAAIYRTQNSSTTI